MSQDFSNKLYLEIHGLLKFLALQLDQTSVKHEKDDSKNTYDSFTCIRLHTFLYKERVKCDITPCFYTSKIIFLKTDKENKGFLP